MLKVVFLIVKAIAVFMIYNETLLFSCNEMVQITYRIRSSVCRISIFNGMEFDPAYHFEIFIVYLGKFAICKRDQFH